MKDVPTDLAEDKMLKRGESDCRVSWDGLVCVKWTDYGAIYFLSNYLNPTAVDTTIRKKKDGTNQKVACPKIIKKYNHHMGYVGKIDMLCEVGRKSKKWWHRILLYFIDLSVVNDFILFKKELLQRLN
ncbi:hypothetical protein GWI33_009177 [Rhynchophorus ferrugineus]|uniref:PiggyBac transposable element-derived protein domain-containing protein n=1 Tax=Rhynchophorus ferrugineus TaxID=354439 RepID=A0A834MFD2_RHYFE|nr:hypothetical protein GWI33_009177 [Rhynchophorus ferrugineus]